jgi:putative two-component system response regulator
MTMSTVTRAPDSSGDRTVRELLDHSRAIEDDNPGQARALAQQARVLARAHQDQPGESEALYLLARVSYSLGREHDALQVALEAAELANTCGDRLTEANSRLLIAIVHYRAGNFSEALPSALAALDLYDKSEHRVDRGNMLNTIATIHHSMRDTDRAIVTYEDAIAANRGLDRPGNDAITLANLASIRAERNEGLLAISLGEEAAALAREHVPAYVPDILAGLAGNYASLQSFDRALECVAEADRAMAERRAAGLEVAHSALANVRVASGRVRLALGQHDLAIEDLNDALVVANGASLRELQLTIHQELSDAYKSLGDFEQALDHQQQRFTIHQELFDHATDLRIKILQIAHDTERARQEAKNFELRTKTLAELVEHRTRALEDFQLEAFQRLAVLAEFRDTDTGEHTIRVGDLSAEIATQLGEDAAWVDQLRLAGRLHDIGKVSVPDNILLKPGPLTAEEFEVMKTHTTVGHEILSGSTSPLIQLAAEVALNHHERWDGNGYPNALASTEIPLSGRVVTVADVYDALISERAYKKAWSTVDAVRYVIGARGTQFEPRIVDAFVQVMERRDPTLRDRLHS